MVSWQMGLPSDAATTTIARIGIGLVPTERLWIILALRSITTIYGTYYYLY